MDRGSATSGHDGPSGLSLVLGRGSSASLPPLIHSAPTCPSGPHPRLGPQGCGLSCSTSALFSLPSVRSPSPRQQTSPSHYRLVPAQPVRLRPPLHSRQSRGTGAPPYASGLPRHTRHRRGVYPYPNEAQSLPLPGLLVPGPAVLFSRPSLRPQCRSVYFYAGPRVASPLPARQGDLPSRLLGRHCHLAPGSRHITGPGPTGYGISPGYGFPPQSREVSSVSLSVGGLVGHPLVASDGPLASSCRGSGGDPSHSSDPLAGPSDYPPTGRAIGGSHQLRVPGPQVPEALPAAARERRHDRPSGRPRHASTTPPSHARSLDLLGIPDPMVACSPVPLQPSVPLPLDGRFDSRMGGAAATVAYGIRRVVADRTSPPCQCTGAPGCSPSTDLLRPPTPVAPHLHRQRVGAIHFGGVPHEVAGPPAGVNRPSLCAPSERPDLPSAPRTYGPQRRGRRSQPRGAAEHGMDTVPVVIRGDSPLGGPAGSGPDGVTNQPPPPSLGVRFSPPGRLGGGLSQYRLGRLQVLVSLPSFGHAAPASPSHPRVSDSTGGGGSLEAPRTVVSPSATRCVLPPSPPHDPLPADRIGDRLAFIRHIRTLDSTAFLQQVLSARYPRRVVDTLLAAYRPSSRRQHDLAWRHFQAWLPADITEISRAQVLEFLQHLFDVVALSPRTILCYRAALKWPLQEAFQVDFGHEDFSRQATGFFHLRPPPSSPLPQWDLNEVLRFYAEVDMENCPLRLAFCKTLFLTALAAGNRCAELAHFSRRALVDRGSSITLGVMPRFLYKNQTASRSPPPVTVPLFRTNPALCPVVTLRTYLHRTANLPHRDFVFVHPSSSASLVAGRLNYWVVQAVSAANIRGSVIRAHDVRKFAFSVNWARRADLPHILSYGFWASAHPFLSHYLTTCPSVLPNFVAAGSLV